MGIIANIWSVLTSGGNFGFIAKNMATIYYYVSSNSFGKTLTEEQKLYATALIDTYGYYQKGIFTETDLQNAVKSSSIGIIKVGAFFRAHESVKQHLYDTLHGTADEYRDLISLTMQIEAMIFEATIENISDVEAVTFVIQKKSTIKRMIKKTLKKMPACPQNSDTYQFVKNLLSWSDFQNIVLNYK